MMSPNVRRYLARNTARMAKTMVMQRRVMSSAVKLKGKKMMATKLNKVVKDSAIIFKPLELLRRLVDGANGA